MLKLEIEVEEDFFQFASKVSFLCVEVITLIDQLTELEDFDREHYKEVIKRIQYCLFPPACNSDAHSISAAFLPPDAMMLLRTLDRELTSHGVVSQESSVDVDSAKEEITSILDDAAHAEVDPAFKAFLKRHLDRVNQGLDAYHQFGSTYVDRIVKSFIADIRHYYSGFDVESENMRIYNRALDLASRLAGYGAKHLLKALPKPEDFPQITHQPNAG